MNQQKKQSITAMLLVITLLFTACGAPQATPVSSDAASVTAQPSVAPTTWINSNVAGSVTAATTANVKDDFYLASNLEWIAKTRIPQGKTRVTSFDQLSDDVEKKVTTLLTDTSLKSHEAVLAQQLYKDYIDIDTRNKLGVTPLAPYIEKIQSIKSIDDMTQYLLDERDNSLFSRYLIEDFSDSNRRALLISCNYVSLEDADEYRKMSELGKTKKAALDVLFPAALMRFGFTKEDATAAWEDAFALEMVLAQDMMGTSDTYQTDYYERLNKRVTIEELRQLSPAFPLAAVLEKSGYGKSDIMLLPETEWLKTLNECYTQENLEAMKSHLMLSLINTYAPYLDQEFQDLITVYRDATTGATGQLPIDRQAYDEVYSLLGDAVGKLYIDEYFSEETKTNIEQMIKNMMEVYRKRLASIDWLTEPTKQKAIEKLDNMRVFVGYPNKRDDFTPLTLKKAAEGGNLVENVRQISQFRNELQLSKINTPTDKDSGEILALSYEVNAFYNPSNNSINIPAGILGGVFYDENGSLASQMGGIGVAIGHEITHAFDTQGSLFDKEGNLSNWWTDEDSAAFKERTDKVAAHFGSFEVLPGVPVNGELVVTEATADLGSLSCMLEIASSMPNFDYEDFFTSYAHIWQFTATKEIIREYAMTDPHPPNYLRGNAVVQQFPEFYETYDVAATDGMYVAPENRIVVW